MPVPVPKENGGSVGLLSVLEADVKQIVTMARETYEKYVFSYICFYITTLSHSHKFYG